MFFEIEFIVYDINILFQNAIMAPNPACGRFIEIDKLLKNSQKRI